jgi:hypothetical protein
MALEISSRRRRHAIVVPGWRQVLAGIGTVAAKPGHPLTSSEHAAC